MSAEPAIRRLHATESERSSNQITGLIHLYRAEVGKLTAYRARLDTTTSWAISSSALGATFAFGDAGVPHTAFLFIMMLVYFFLQLEARRFRHYEASRQRVQLMEASFFPELLRGRADPAWIDELLRDLRTPGLPVSQHGALGWRLRRTYLWIYAALATAWLTKLDLLGGLTGDPRTLVTQAAVGSIPGWAVLFAVASFYSWLLIVASLARRHYPKGDDEQVETTPIEPTE